MLSREDSGGDGAGSPRVDIGSDMLSGFPGPAVIVDISGGVEAANPAGEPLAPALRDHMPAVLSDLVRQALAGCVVRQGALQFGDRQPLPFLDATVMPIAGRDAALVLLRDQSLEGRLRAALVESRQRYKDLVEISSDFAWETGADGRFAFVSPRGALGWKPEGLVGRSAEEFAVAGEALGGGSPFTARERMDGVEVQFRRADGAIAVLEASAGPVLDSAGKWTGARGVCRDVTVAREQQRALARARRRENLINRIVRAMREEIDPVNMLQVAADATAEALPADGVMILRLNKAGYEMGASHAGASRADLVVDLAGKLDPAGRESLRVELQGLDMLAHLTSHSGKVNGVLALWRDAGGAGWEEDGSLLTSEVAGHLGIAIEQIAAHESIVNLSRTDGLTGLLNRRAFFGDLERFFRRLQRDGESAALIYVDLDNFKLVNDVHGHEHGDEALLAVRDLLQSHTRPGDLVARLGGDEFAMWLSSTDEETAAARAIRLLDESRGLGRFSGDGNRLLGMSLGIAVYRAASGEDLKGLLARADAAMYEVKHGGKGSYRIAPAAAASGAA